MKLMRSSYLSGFSYRFQQLSRAHGQVTYVLLTRSPLSLFESKLSEGFVRLACIRHAASVHPEPGSNSPFDLAQTLTLRFVFSYVIFSENMVSQVIDVSCLVFKDRNVLFRLRFVQRSYIIHRIIFHVNNFFKLFAVFCHFLFYRSIY